MQRQQRQRSKEVKTEKRSSDFETGQLGSHWSYLRKNNFRSLGCRGVRKREQPPRSPIDGWGVRKTGSGVGALGACWSTQAASKEEKMKEMMQYPDEVKTQRTRGGGWGGLALYTYKQKFKVACDKNTGFSWC